MEEEPVGQRLRRLRLEKGLSQLAVAAPRYSGAYVSQVESGKRRPSSSALAHFAEQLGVTFDELATGRPRSLAAELELRLQEGYEDVYAARYRAADEAFEVAAAAAREYNLHAIEARAEEGQGLVAEREGNPEDALAHYERALELWESSPLSRRVEAVAGVARCTQMRGDVRYAIHILETYLMRLRREGLEDPVALMRGYSSLIWPYTEAGLYQQASEAASSALRYEPKIEERAEVASMYMNVARELLRRGDADEALASLKRAEDLYRVLNWKTELARAHANKAIVLAQQGDLEGSRSETLQALDLIRGTSSKLSEARALNELARVDRLLGRLEEARKVLEQSLRLLRKGDVGERALAYRELGLCLFESDKEASERHLRKAIVLYRQAGQYLHVAATCRDLGDLLCSRGKDESGREAYREGLLAVDEAVAA